MREVQQPLNPQQQQVPVLFTYKRFKTGLNWFTNQTETKLEEVQPLTLQQQQVPVLFTYKHY